MKSYGKTLSEKTVDCMCLCALPIMGRAEMLARLEQKWSLKAVYATIENHGRLFEWGTSSRHAWLTPEGELALMEALAPDCTPVQ